MRSLPLLALTLLSAACTQEAPPARRTTPVVARRPTRLDLPVTLRYPAELRPLRETEIQPLEVTGYVTTLLVDRGHSVKAGQELARLDCSAYADERTRRREALRQREARHGFARQTVERLKPMAERKFLGAQDLARAEADAAQADAELAQAAAALRTAETRVRDCVLIAPFDGDITARHVDVGARVGPGTSLFTLVDSRTLRATVHLVDRDAGRVRAGQSAKLSVEAWPGKTFTGRVERVVKALDRSTRTMAAEVDIDNAEDLLRPGLFARLDITVETHPGALLVPAGALLVQERDVSLFVADGKVARRRAVKLGFDDGAWVEIVDGLKAEDLVIVQGKDLLGDGAMVEVRVDPAATSPVPAPQPKSQEAAAPSGKPSASSTPL